MTKIEKGLSVHNILQIVALRTSKLMKWQFVIHILFFFWNPNMLTLVHCKDTSKANDKDWIDIKICSLTVVRILFRRFPNAGKSTLLSAVSRASPKIAAYPCTYLRHYFKKIAKSVLCQVLIEKLKEYPVL